MKKPAFLAAVLSAFLLITAAAPAVHAQTAGGSAAQIDPARLQAAKELLKVTKADRNMAAILPMMLKQLRAMMPPLGPDAQKARDEVMDEVEKQFKGRTGEVIDKIAVLYARRFTVEEMRAVAAFYRTRPGQKFVAALPELATEGMKIGQQWGRQIGLEAQRKIREEMAKRGYKL